MPRSTRRTFIAGAGIAGAAALAGAKALPKNRKFPLEGITREKIKITGIRMINLGYRLKPEEEWADADFNMIIWKTESVIVQVSTDAGITGIGGCTRYNGPEQMKQYAETVIKPILVGKNPFDVESLSGGICGHGARGA
jgi:hypothetical protein